MIIMELAGRPDGGTTAYDGQFLKDFDFEANDGRGSIQTTTKIEEAKRFNSIAEAFDFYRQSPSCKPLRPDGKPNRPLTATNWTFRSV